MNTVGQIIVIVFFVGAIAFLSKLSGASTEKIKNLQNKQNENDNFKKINLRNSSMSSDERADWLRKNNKK